MKPAVILLGVALSLSAAAARAGGGPSAAFTTEAYAAVLGAVVGADGTVDYAALKARREPLDAFTASLGRLDPPDYRAWDAKTKVAFWLNAYNALTLKLIVDHYPLPADAADPAYPANSIRQIAGAWDAIAFVVMGEKMTLDDIENEILRKQFHEPRIHMALVCAARSCPPLRDEPYTGAELDAQLDDQAHRFLAKPSALAIDRGAGVVRVSAIFDWFGGDFVEQYGRTGGRFDPPLQAVVGFLGRYLSDADRAYLEKGDYRVEHLEYDWTLNERKQ